MTGNQSGQPGRRSPSSSATRRRSPSAANRATAETKSLGSGAGRGVKSRHIIEEHIDIGVPRDTVYNQWTQYQDLSRFTKRESAKRSDENDGRKVSFESRIGPSRRKWDAEVTERTPGQRIAWRSVGGARNMGVVTFHQLVDKNLTCLMVEMEYHPSGVIETVGNFLRMPRRRVRKDLKLFKHFIELRGEATGKGPGRVKGRGGLQTHVHDRIGVGQQG